MIKNSFQIRKCPQYSIFQTRKRGKNYTIHFTPHTTYVRSYIYKQTQREGEKEKWRGRERKGRDRRKEGKRGRRRKGMRQGTKKGEKEKERENSWLCHVVFEISYIWFRFEFDNLFQVKSICRYLKNNDEGKNARDVTTYCGNRRPIQVAGWNSSLQSRFL